MDQSFIKAVSLQIERKRWNDVDHVLLFPKAEWSGITNSRPVSLLLQSITLLIFVLYSIDCLASNRIDWLNFQYPLVFNLFSLFFLAGHSERRDLIPASVMAVVIFIDLFCIINAAMTGADIFQQLTHNLVYYTAPVSVANSAVFKPRIALAINLMVLASLAYAACLALLAVPGLTADLPLLARVVGVVGFYLWFSLAQFIAFSLYMRHRLELVEVHHLVAEMERNRKLNDENARIREDLLRTQRVQMVDSMTSTMAHEVNQPISCANNFIQAARRWLSRDEPDVGEALSALGGAQDEIVRVSDRVMSVRRLMQRLSSEFTSIDLADLLGRVDDMVRRDLHEKGIGLAIETGDDADDCFIYGCEEELIQVLMNLIANSVDALAEPGQVPVIRVSLAEADLGEVEIVVADNGCGVPAENIARVFDRLYSTKPGGSGLGLALCKRIVANHGGTIGITSQQGKGTQVILRFPQAELRSGWAGGRR